MLDEMFHADYVAGGGFSYSKNMANFEEFQWNISSSINLLFLKSEVIEILLSYIYLSGSNFNYIILGICHNSEIHI